MKTFYRFLTSLLVSSFFRSVVASCMKKTLLTPLAVLMLMLTGCTKIADTLRPDPIPTIPIGADVLASDNVRFVGSEGDISGHKFDTAASAYDSEVVRSFFKEQQALIDTHCPLKEDEPLPKTDFFLVYFPSRTERDQFVSHLPGERVIWYTDVVSIVINEEIVNYSAELSLIITEACQAQTHVFPYPANVEAGVEP
ncbi:MAG: hypothetical protein OXI43_12350 [Candidatus Poribacteria bacterium]|nr:hypothetical protein [Candidatus Poribacteria bacterium]